MAIFSIKSVAFKWYFFTSASFMVYAEFSHIIMKQLVLNPQQIGMTNLFGVQHIFIPLLLYLGDRFRARNFIIWMVSFISAINCLLPLLPMVVSLPTCFETKSRSNSSSGHSSNFTGRQNVPWMSSLFLLMTVSRSSVTFLEAVAVSLASVATTSYLGNERAKFGAYYGWSHFGTSILVGVSAVLAWTVRINICGIEGYGYFASLLLASIFLLFSLLSLPFFEFEYKTDRTISWKELKLVLFNGHYIYMFIMTFYLGVCVAFQCFWEFWYLDGLQASPLVMGGAALVRRPFLAASLFGSGYVIRKIGDLYTVCMSFLLFAVAFFALSFTRVYWYVLAVDMFPSAAYGLGFSAFTVHFSKAGSEANSGLILGLLGMFFMFGCDCSAAFLGLLFHAIGTQSTLIIYAAMTTIVLVILLLYIQFSKQVKDYERLPLDSDSDDEDNDSGD